MHDENKNRLRRIKLIEREQVENAPIWLEKQQLQFPSAISLTSTPSLGQAISKEMQTNSYNEDVFRPLAELNFK